MVTVKSITTVIITIKNHTDITKLNTPSLTTGPNMVKPKATPLLSLKEKDLPLPESDLMVAPRLLPMEPKDPDQRPLTKTKFTPPVITGLTTPTNTVTNKPPVTIGTPNVTLTMKPKLVPTDGVKPPPFLIKKKVPVPVGVKTELMLKVTSTKIMMKKETTGHK